MKHLLLILFVCVPLFSQPTCTSPQVDDIGPTSVRLRVTADASFTYARTLYNVIGSAQKTQGTDSEAFVSGGGHAYMILGGLTPATAYTATPQVSANNSTWCTSSAVTFVTAPESSFEPTPPVEVSPNPRTAPTVTGTTYNATTCAEVNTMWRALVPGDKLSILYTLDCSSDDWTSSQLKLSTADGARGWKVITSIDNTTNTITKAAHGLSNGQLIRFSPSEYYYAYIYGGLKTWLNYYVVGATTDTFQVSLTSGGSAVDLFTAGSIAAGTTAFKLAAAVNPIIITTSAESMLPPLGIRVTSADRAYMPKFRCKTEINTGTACMDFRQMADPVWIRGLDIILDGPGVAGAADMNGAGHSIATTMSQRGFTLAQISMRQEALYPKRVRFEALHLDGQNAAVVDSLFENLTAWVPWNKSMTPSYVGNTLTIAAGTYFLGDKKCTTASPATAVLSAGSSGVNGVVYLNYDCSMVVEVPTGYAGVCTNCTLSVVATPSFHLSGGVRTKWSIATLGLGSAVFNAVDPGNPSFYYGGDAGTNAITTTFGPGPILIENNLIKNSPGVAGYFTDGGHYDNPQGNQCNSTTCGTIEIVDIAVRGNDFINTAEVMYPDDGTATTRIFRMRQAGVEFKDCRRCEIVGNNIDFSYADVTYGPAIALTPLTVANTALYPSIVTVRDTRVEGNRIIGPTGIAITGIYPGPRYAGVPARKIKIANNFFDVDLIYRAPNRPNNGSNGAIMTLGAQQLTIQRNTIKNISGDSGNFLQVRCFPISVKFDRNLAQANNRSGTSGLMYSSCDTTLSSSPQNVYSYGSDLVTNGVISSPYSWTGNTLIGGWSTDNTTEMTQAQVTTLAARHLTASWPAGETIAARLASGNISSAWVQTYAQTAGLDESVMAASRGKITGVPQATSTSTTINVWWFAPSSTGCWVDLSTNGGISWTNLTQSSTGSRLQSVTFTGMAVGVYTPRVRCAADIQQATPVAIR